MTRRMGFAEKTSQRWQRCNRRDDLKKINPDGRLSESGGE